MNQQLLFDQCSKIGFWNGVLLYRAKLLPKNHYGTTEGSVRHRNQQFLFDQCSKIGLLDGVLICKAKTS